MFVLDTEFLKLHNARAAEMRAQAAEYRLARSVSGGRRHRRLRRRRHDPQHGPARTELP